MTVDAFLTKTLATSGTSTQYPVGPISNGGSNVDEFDLGLLGGTEGCMLVVNVTAVSGTSPTMTPTFETDDNTGFTSTLNVWTAPVAIAATGLYEYTMPKIRERYGRLATGTIGGSATPTLTFTAYVTPFINTGRL